MNIIVDAFGGDNAPLEVIKGAADAVAKLDVDVTLTGNESIIKKTAEENGISLDRISIIHTESVIDIHEEPTEVIKGKSDCSMAVGLKALAEGKGDAFVSAGSTGALVVGATFIAKRLKGIKRAALAPILPTAIAITVTIAAVTAIAAMSSLFVLRICAPPFNVISYHIKGQRAFILKQL